MRTQSSDNPCPTQESIDRRRDNERCPIYDEAGVVRSKDANQSDGSVYLSAGIYGAGGLIG